MRRRSILVTILLVYALISLACVYIVLPEGLESSDAASEGTAGWSAVATNVEKSESGDLRIDLTLRNDTGDWSTMKAADDKQALLTSDGKSTSCETTFVSSGGHRLAPGFQMRGYTGGTKAEPATQQIYVECAGGEAAPGSKLLIPYSYVTGQYNYYEQDKNKVDGELEIDLDEVATDLVYPAAEPVDGLVQDTNFEIVALNKVLLRLKDVQRTNEGLKFTWETSNPGEYPTYVHIGTPPVIGADGILYGYYETMDIVSAPITPAGGNAEWTTEVSVPQDLKGFYILLSVETGKARLFSNYAIDITDY